MAFGAIGSGAQAPNMVSVSNSSTSALNDSTTFTGAWEDVSAYDSAVVAVKTDQNGVFMIDFSPDGANVDSTLTRYYRTSQIEAPHRFTVTRQFCRVRFTNDSGSNQTYFRLQTTFGSKMELNAPQDSALAQDFDAIVTRPTQLDYEVVLGRRQGWTSWDKWGYNEDVDTGATETIWSVGGRFVPMASADTLNLVSSSTADDDGGTGANSVLIWGIDENRDPQIEIVTLDGQTPVTTSNQWFGVNRVSLYLSGTGKVNAGTIDVTVTTGGAAQAQIPAGLGSTQQCIFHVPRNHQALCNWLFLNANKLSGGGTPRVTFKMWVHSAVSNSMYEVFRHVMDTTVENHIALNPKHPFPVGESSIIELTADTSVSNTIVDGRFSLIQVRDVDA